MNWIISEVLILCYLYSLNIWDRWTEENQWPILSFLIYYSTSITQTAVLDLTSFSCVPPSYALSISYIECTEIPGISPCFSANLEKLLFLGLVLAGGKSPSEFLSSLAVSANTHFLSYCFKDTLWRSTFTLAISALENNALDAVKTPWKRMRYLFQDLTKDLGSYCQSAIW